MDNATRNARATSIDELVALHKKMDMEASFVAGMKLSLRPSDVVIAPYTKSGTTWLQQIVHTLRTRGDMDFDDISRVVPWIETSTALGVDLTAEQKAEPRAFKSHLDADAIPKGGRYIISIRDPGDALVSMYNFMVGWFIEPGTVTLDEFARHSFIASGAYWKHLLSWWRRRNDPDVLYLVYEHMRQDLAGTIRRVARFIGVELDADLLALTEERSSLKFMQEHKDRFDDLLMRRLTEQRGNLPSDSDSSKVREGKVGSRQVLSNQVQAELDRVWKSQITPETAYESYAALIADLR